MIVQDAPKIDPALVQRFFERKKAELVRELDLLKEQFPHIYTQSSSFFCEMAKAGRATFDPPISYPEDLRVQGVLCKYPCYDFYGAGSNYRLRIAWARIKKVRQVFNAQLFPADPKMHNTAFENWLYYCKYIERTPVIAPISANNPLLQLLVTLIEEHIAQ